MATADHAVDTVQLATDDKPRSCYADSIGPGYERDPERRCQWVDADGELLVTLNGRPVCYDDQTEMVSCKTPGAHRPRN